MFSFPVGGGWPQMASRGVSHAALGRAAVRAVLFIRLAAQVCSRKGSWPQDYIKNWVGEGSQEWAGFSSFLETICLSLFLHFLGNNFVWLRSLSVSSKLRLALDLDLLQFSNTQLYLRMCRTHPSSLISLSSLGVLISTLQEDWFRQCVCTILRLRVLCH